MRDDAMRRNVLRVHGMHAMHLVRFVQIFVQRLAATPLRRVVIGGLRPHTASYWFRAVHVATHMQFRSSSSSLNRPWLP